MAEQQKAQLAFPRTLSLAQQCFPVALPWVPNPLPVPCINKEYRLLWNSAWHGPETPSTHAFLLFSSPKILKRLGSRCGSQKTYTIEEERGKGDTLPQERFRFLSLKKILRRKSIAELNHGCSYPEKKEKRTKELGAVFLMAFWDILGVAHLNSTKRWLMSLCKVRFSPPALLECGQSSART